MINTCNVACKAQRIINTRNSLQWNFHFITHLQIVVILLQTQKVIEFILISRILQIRFLHFHLNHHLSFQKKFQLIIFEIDQVKHLIFFWKRCKNDSNIIINNIFFRVNIFDIESQRRFWKQRNQYSSIDLFQWKFSVLYQNRNAKFSFMKNLYPRFCQMRISSIKINWQRNHEFCQKLLLHQQIVNRE